MRITERWLLLLARAAGIGEASRRGCRVADVAVRNKSCAGRAVAAVRESAVLVGVHGTCGAGGLNLALATVPGAGAESWFIGVGYAR